MTRPRLLLSDVVLGWFYGALYWVIVALVCLRSGWVACQQVARDRLWRMAARWPRCRPLVQSLLRDVGRTHIGTPPSKPTILGVVLVQQLGGPTDLRQLAALITWAAHQGLQEVFLYDPQGWLQLRARELEKRVAAAALAAGGTNGSSPAVTFHVGWPPLEEQLAAGEQQQQQQQWGEPPPPQGAGTAAPAAVRRRGKSSGTQQSPPPQQQRRLRVVLLSGADAHWPLAQAAFAAAVAGGMPGPAILGSGTVAAGGASALMGRAGALEGAAAAGGCHCLGRLPQQLSSDGSANASAHPAGAAAAAVSSGSVGTQTGFAHAAGQQQGQQQQELKGHAAGGSWGGSSASLSHLGAPSDGGSSCGGSCSGGGAPLDEGRVEGAIAAPARLKARLEAAAGPLAAAEPDLVMVFGEALTLAGFPPWAARTCEIYHAGLLCDLSAAGLHHILQRFLGTKQRFGV